MALPTAAPHRQLKHRRRIDVQVHARGNGLWEVDAEISDVKTRDIPTGGGNHLTELTQVLPTAVVQAFAGDVLDTRDGDGERRPFQIDGCHALRGRRSRDSDPLPALVPWRRVGGVAGACTFLLRNLTHPSESV